MQTVNREFAASAPALLAQVGVNDLLYQVARGDRAAYRTLFDCTRRKIYGVCLRILKERASAEDATQDAFVRVFVRAQSYLGVNDGEAMAWLIAIARNACFDVLRRRQVRGEVLLSESDLHQHMSEAGDVHTQPEAITAQRADARLLTQCLNELAGERAALIRTIYSEGITYAEAAARTSTPLPTVKSHVRRGLLALRECLSKNGRVRMT